MEMPRNNNEELAAPGAELLGMEQADTEQAVSAPSDGVLSPENLDPVTEAMGESSRSTGRFSRAHDHHIVAGYLGKLRLQAARNR